MFIGQSADACGYVHSVSADVDIMFIGLSAAVNIIICIHMAISCCGYHVHRAVS